ncbi:AraC family transcriptional regulator [Singulisphaera acidiphila]|uniref:DNA-binding domain-containing protein, AraC-type n=1 Tax=Singulisphaera acidiphila (strain ATCC BAA-1392 / DSM 18658 / VKM B-2454 / MOB10) TaxID=886293 RepID=L0DPT3_SINAD|nr:DNA-binding domain-containing protein, AraC-type [Singulisphaera acidiphila DSM 18658]
MEHRADIRDRLAGLLDEVAHREGRHPTHIDGVEVIRTSTSSMHRVPVVYQPRILIVGRGRKRVYLGDEVYQYDPFNYLALSVPLPAECEWEASREDPVLVVSVAVDPAMLGQMLIELDEPPPPVATPPRGISTTPMSEELGVAACRLVECLKCPVDSRMLGRQLVREVVYRVLRGERDGAVRSLAGRDDHFSGIARVLRHVHAEYAKPLKVEELARMAGMSPTVFHHHFKVVTSSSPLQYLKRVRLDHARRMMTHDGYNASTAARAVGYESASQFGREFKRLFGVTPAEEAGQMRARLVAN